MWRWSFLLLLGGCAQEARRPNIILISIDSLRADHVGAYGYERDTTPTLDRLAAEGALFENVVADSSWTLPTHVTMFTGLGSLSHGVDEFAGRRIAPAHQTVAERLHEAGYRTLGVYSGPYLHPVFGLDRGFDRYEAVSDFGLDDLDAAQEITRANSRAHRTVTSPAVTDKAIELLDELDDGEFFLFLHYFDVHYDYIPPEELWRRFDPDYEGSISVENYRRNEAIRPEMDPDDLEHILARYDGEILFTDQHIGKLINALDERGLTDETLIVVTADHGEEFFEHGRKGHGQNLFDEVVMVPWILRLPGHVPAGTRITHQARHVDIAPTLLAFAGIDAELEGRNLEPALTTGASDIRALGAVSSLRRNGHWLALRRPDKKYVMYRRASETTEAFYDLASDPDEKSPIGTTPDELRRELKAVEAWSQTFRDQTAAGASVEDLPESVREQLRSLGYIQ